jgi:protein-tyrosine-phosphatase
MSAPRILVVCTANECRSPMTAALLARRLREHGIHAEIASAGSRSTGRPVAPRAVDALAGRGVDLPDRLSRSLDAAEIEAADLVIGMAREHVREVLVLAPDAADRTFTLKELVRRAEASPRQARVLREWLAPLAAERSSRELLGHAAADDVADPIGGSKRRFRASAAEIDDLVTRLVRAAWS